MSNESVVRFPGQENRSPLDTLAALLLGLLILLLGLEVNLASHNRNLEARAAAEKAECSALYQARVIRTEMGEIQGLNMNLMAISSGTDTLRLMLLDTLISALNNDLLRYEMEKQEILQGSTSLPPDQWVLNEGGLKGQFRGIRQWEALLDQYQAAAEQYDVAFMYGLLALFAGLILLFIQNKLTKSLLLGLLIAGTLLVGWLVWDAWHTAGLMPVE